jgi:hypothetical protein
LLRIERPSLYIESFIFASLRLAKKGMLLIIMCLLLERIKTSDVEEIKSPTYSSVHLATLLTALNPKIANITTLA